ncbi:MAG: peptidase M22, partial [Verrucomicrobiota bacterium]|nr:peptidase M22 [Verrucomicrobiota bacterium]
VRAFAFCEGPGSILGIRTAAMALRVWNVFAPRPTFSFCSLKAVAYDLAAHRSGETFSVIADARRNTWHRVTVQIGLVGPLRRASPAELPSLLFMPENFRAWSAPPLATKTASYDLAGLLPRVAEADLFHPVDEPDAFMHEMPSYQTWTPRIHGAAGP